MKFNKGARYLFTKEYDVEGFMEFAAREGFDFVQVSYEAPLKWVGEISKDRRERIRTLAERLGLQICIHSVTCGVNVAWTNSGMRQESLRQIKESIEFAHDVGAELLIVHPGWKDLIGYRHPEEAYALAIEGHQELAEAAATYGIRIGIENMPPRWTSFCIDAEGAKTMIQTVDRENVGLTLDIGHANLVGVNAIEAFITTLSAKIFLIHVHDNDGKGDEHKAIGEGTIDFPKLIDLLVQTGINAPLCIESSSLDDLIKSKANLEQFLIMSGPKASPQNNC
jgi:sugar phosphate isomerase/epimerase